MPKTSPNTSSSLNAHGQTILCAVLLAGSKARQIDIISTQITKLPYIRWRDKARTHQVALEKFGNPLCVFLVGFLALDGFDVLGVRQSAVTSLFGGI